MRDSKRQKSRSRRDKGTEYLEAYPKLVRWINQCAGCQAIGHKPDLPENIYPWFNLAAHNLRRFYDPLELNEVGLCNQCAQAVELPKEVTA